MWKGQASRPGTAHYIIQASELCILSTFQCPTHTVTNGTGSWVASTVGCAGWTCATRSKPREGTSQTEIFLIFPHIRVSQPQQISFFTFGFLVVWCFFFILEWPTCFSSVFFKLLESKKGFLLPRYTVLSSWEPGSLAEVSRHLCSRNNSTAQLCIESTRFSIRSHFMPQVATVKHICCMKIIHCQLQSKVK